MTDELYNTLYRKRDVQMLAALSKYFLKFAERPIIRSFYENNELMKKREYYKYPYELSVPTNDLNKQINNPMAETASAGKVIATSPSYKKQSGTASNKISNAGRLKVELSKYDKRNSVTIESPCIDGQGQAETKNSDKHKFSTRSQRTSSQKISNELSPLVLYNQIERQYALDHAYFLISKTQLTLNNRFIEAYCKLLCRWKNYEKMTALYRYQIMPDDIHNLFQTFSTEPGWERTSIPIFLQTHTPINSITQTPFTTTDSTKTNNAYFSNQFFMSSNTMRETEELTNHVSSYKEPNIMLNERAQNEENRTTSLRRSMGATKGRNKQKRKKQSSQRDLSENLSGVTASNTEHENNLIHHGTAFSAKIGDSTNKLHETKTVIGTQSDVINNKQKYCNDTNTTTRIPLSSTANRFHPSQGSRNAPSSLNLSGLRTTEPSPPDHHIDTQFHHQFSQEISEPHLSSIAALPKYQYTRTLTRMESLSLSRESGSEISLKAGYQDHIETTASAMLENIIDLNATEQSLCTNKAANTKNENVHQPRLYNDSTLKSTARENTLDKEKQDNPEEPHRRFSMDSQYPPQRFTKTKDEDSQRTGKSFKPKFLCGESFGLKALRDEQIRSSDDAKAELHFSGVEQSTTSEQPELLQTSPNYPRCGACETQIHGLAVICARCGHCGHPLHYKKWFKQNSICPTLGCECHCKEYFKADVPSTMIG